MPNVADYRTIIDFYRMIEIDDEPYRSVVRTVPLLHTIPNVVVGQNMSFDHPTLTDCLTGKVTNINHVVFLVDRPLTYIDVEVK